MLNEDHNHHRIGLEQEMDLGGDVEWNEDAGILEEDGFAGTEEYQTGFAVAERDLVERTPGTSPLSNNVPFSENLAPGEAAHFVFESAQVYGSSGTFRTGLPGNTLGANMSSLQKRDRAAGPDGFGVKFGDLLKRQTSNGTSKFVYISANTCLQPLMNSGRAGSPPQLSLYISANESDITSIGTSNASGYTFEQGYVSVKVIATGDVFFSIVANNLTDNFSGQWAYSIAASIDAPYFYYEEETPLIWTVDTDSKSALLATLNLTDSNPIVSNETKAIRQQWMDMVADPPFTMRIYNSSSPNITGIERSYCGLQKQDINPVTISYNMTTRGVGGNPKQQFYATGLEPGQDYTAILAYDGVNMTNSSVVGGGGQLWKSIPFTTKTGVLHIRPHLLLFR